MARGMLVQVLGEDGVHLSSLVTWLAAGEDFSRGGERQTTCGDAVMQVCRSYPKKIAPAWLIFTD